LYRPTIYPIDVPDWKTLSKRLTPELWGYCWTRHARIKFTKKHANLYIWRKPARITKGPLLAEDGKFGPKTEAAVIKFQRKAALPDDGIAGPEVWEYLFPYWVVRIIVVRVDTPTTTPQPAPAPAPAKCPFVGSPFAESTLDNIATQLGMQLDKNGLTSIFVMQGTWKTITEPNEIVPGHWEHTGGLQLNTPTGSPVGQNLQAFYQLTRADILKHEFSDEVGVSADVWLQPSLQFPLDKGTSSNPNIFKVGMTAGATVSLELKPDKDGPTLKVFLQGGYAVSVDKTGTADSGWQAVGGLSIEFDADKLIAGITGGRSSPAQQAGVGIQANPGTVVLKPGGSANVDITVTRAAQGNAQLTATHLPQGVSAGMFDRISQWGTTGVLHLTAAPDAPSSDVSNVLVGANLAASGERETFVGIRIRVIVRP
jgi:hypothetical protein